nr:MAG TPA: hypothetical protein [Caudoviricetes sp.]
MSNRQKKRIEVLNTASMVISLVSLAISIAVIIFKVM